MINDEIFFSRINAYRALASPSLISLSSKVSSDIPIVPSHTILLSLFIIPTHPIPARTQTSKLTMSPPRTQFSPPLSSRGSCASWHFQSLSSKVNIWWGFNFIPWHPRWWEVSPSKILSFLPSSFVFLSISIEWHVPTKSLILFSFLLQSSQQLMSACTLISYIFPIYSYIFPIYREMVTHPFSAPQDQEHF